MTKRAVPFSTAGGRKWMMVWWFQALGVVLIAGVVVQAIFLPDLDTSALIQILGLMASIAGVFLGVQGAIDFRVAGQDGGQDPPTDVELSDDA